MGTFYCNLLFVILYTSLYKMKMFFIHKMKSKCPKSLFNILKVMCFIILRLLIVFAQFAQTQIFSYIIQICLEIYSLRFYHI